MPRITSILLLFAFAFTACERTEEQPIEDDPVRYMSFGEEVRPEGPAHAPADLDADPHAFHGQDVRVEGTVVEVCLQDGCWLALENPAGDPVRVDVRRDEFDRPEWTLPRDLGPRHAIIEGIAYADTLSGEQLRRYAQQAGRPEQDIDGIAEGRIAAHVVARGMLIDEPIVPARPGDESN
jgi:hypothetical protein